MSYTSPPSGQGAQIKSATVSRRRDMPQDSETELTLLVAECILLA
jgi:hypothetical protein